MIDFGKTNTVRPAISLSNHAVMFQHHRVHQKIYLLRQRWMQFEAGLDLPHSPAKLRSTHPKWRQWNQLLSMCNVRPTETHLGHS